MTPELRALPKIDAHHHLWDLEHNDYPWLREPCEPRIYGDYRAMCRSYLIDDYLADSAPHAVIKSVHVQANWDPTDPVGETRWCQSVANRHGFPHAIVAHADLADTEVERVLAAHAESQNLRGIRQILGHTDDAQLARRDRPDHLHDPAWDRGYALLAKYNLSFDLQVFPPQMAAAAEVVGRHEDVPVVVCHTGFPWDRSESGVAEWRNGMRRLAALPHVHAKLSGPGMVMVDWTAKRFAPFIHETIEMFAPRRCMFASNVPPDALHKTYDQIYAAFYTWAADYSSEEQRHLFHDTAARVYRI
jgi:predicted TIM-barrel fold metal-dependent hydrolase